tara:strand:- start:8 stop:196 length:189 start_codon:yes stop_codon:yes gene_type:complete
MLVLKGDHWPAMCKPGMNREAYGRYHLLPALNQWVQGLQPAAAPWETTLTIGAPPFHQQQWL